MKTLALVAGVLALIAGAPAAHATETKAAGVEAECAGALTGLGTSTVYITSPQLAAKHADLACELQFDARSKVGKQILAWCPMESLCQVVVTLKPEKVIGRKEIAQLQFVKRCLEVKPMSDGTGLWCYTY